MPLSPEEIYANVVEQVGPEGRLPMPPVAEWDVFPWEQVDGTWLPKVVRPPLDAEPPRHGEGDRPQASWRNDRWLVTSME